MILIEEKPVKTLRLLRWLCWFGNVVCWLLVLPHMMNHTGRTAGRFELAGAILFSTGNILLYEIERRRKIKTALRCNESYGR